MLLHVEVQLLGLAGEHFGELEEAEEEHQLQVLTGQLFALLGGGLAAGGGFAGGVDRGPVVFQVRGLGDGGRGQRGRVRGGGGVQGEEVHLHLIIAAGVEDVAPLRQRFEQDGRVGAKGGDEAGLDALHLRRDDVRAEVVLGHLRGLADAQLSLVLGDAVLHHAQGAGDGGDVGGQLATGIVGGEPLEAIGGEGDELRHADVRIVEGVFEEGGKRSHGGGVCVR